MPISILLLDDHAVVRDGLQALLGAQLDLRVVGSFGVAGEAVRFASESPPDVAVLDIALGGLDGIEAIGKISAANKSPHRSTGNDRGLDTMTSQGTDNAQVRKAPRKAATKRQTNPGRRGHMYR